MRGRLPVGFVAPSSPVPQVEFGMGLGRLEKSGFLPFVHPSCMKRSGFFAGSDAERAEAFIEYAWNAELPVLWCARGGYGANRLLPLLDRSTRERGVPPRKLLVGYSDATALLEFVHSRWNWSTLHGAMPSFRSFLKMKRAEWDSTVEFVRGRSAVPPWARPGFSLKFLGGAPKDEVRGYLTGGNLSVWCALAGTPDMPTPRDRILFFEDVAEPFSRLDRMVQQLFQCGLFEGAKAVILGDFLECADGAPGVLRKEPSAGSRARVLKKPRPSELKPLRPVLSRIRSLEAVFGPVRDRYGIPVAYGLPVGHGPNYSPLPLNAEYALTGAGKLSLLHWDWIGSDAVEAARRIEDIEGI